MIEIEASVRIIAVFSTVYLATLWAKNSIPQHDTKFLIGATMLGIYLATYHS
jgi:hypothetical protein